METDDGSIAHEIAHAVIHSRFPELEQRFPKSILEKRIVDEAAGRILVPTSSLQFAIKHLSGELSTELIEAISRRFGSSLSSIVKRISDLAQPGRITLHNAAIVVDMDNSRKKDQNFAPRVRACCVPHGCFIPINSRLVGIGMRSIPDLFLSINRS